MHLSLLLLVVAQSLTEGVSLYEFGVRLRQAPRGIYNFLLLNPVETALIAVAIILIGLVWNRTAG